MKAVKSLTNMGTDVRKIAKLLQAKAPAGHKLAYINDEEAALLKARGGSGRITESGIPSYEETYYSDPTSLQGQQPVAETTPTSIPAGSEIAPPSEASYTPPPVDINIPTGDAGIPSGGVNQPNFTQSENVSAPQPATPKLTTGLTPSELDLSQLGAATAPPGERSYTPATTPTEPSFTESLLKQLKQPSTLASLGIGGAQALLGASSVRKAQAEAQAAKQQLQALASPYQQQGQQLQAAAQRGELTPANQQVLQAAQAQLAQGAASRGGVGVQQASNQMAMLTQNLLANQMNMGIQLQGVGDKIAQGAIQTGIQADQYINNLTSQYAQNIARTVAGAAGLPQQQPTVTVTTSSGT
jgi:hypothetical protein